MYYSGLRKLIASVEEKRFYDVAIMYLNAQRYRNVAIVDGSGDGGRDVTTDRDDLRIQLSVRAKWEDKINEEAANTQKAGLRHLIYVTNKLITPQAEERFRASQYKFAGKVDVSIHDLNRITTALARTGRIQRAYALLGVASEINMQATPQEIALSSILLFGSDVKELRRDIVDANVRAWILKNPGASEVGTIDEVGSSLPGASMDKAVTTSISRLRTEGRIVGPPGAIRLSDAETAEMKNAEAEFLLSLASDIKALQKVIGLGVSECEELLKLSLDVLLRGKSFSGGGPSEEGVQAFLSKYQLTRRRDAIFKALAETGVARRFQYSQTVDQIFQTNTFDIYRALGGQTKIIMVLDTSVALPMIFGLEFAAARSRYSVAATTLQDVCKTHDIKIVVPRPYLNEMAFHGTKALDFLASYDSLPEDLKPFLRGSANAYLSHFSHIKESSTEVGNNLTLDGFLKHFGISPGRSIRQIENKITSILERQGFEVVFSSQFNQDIRDDIARKKYNQPKHIIDHDAAVCTALLDGNQNGYILATWDKVLIDEVQEVARIYSDSPARVTDFLSVIDGLDTNGDHSEELLTTLLHMDERAAASVAQQLDLIKRPAQAFQLHAYIDDARAKHGVSWLPDADDLSRFLDETSEDSISKSEDT